MYMISFFNGNFFIETNISSPNAPIFVLTFTPYSQLLRSSVKTLLNLVKPLKPVNPEDDHHIRI